MDVGAPLVADRQASELAEPSQGAFDHPAVPPQPGAALDPAPRDAGLDVAAGQGTTAAAVIVGLVGVELAWPLARPAPGLPDRRHGVDHLLQHRTVMHVRARQANRERDAVCIREDVALRARLAPVGRVRPRLRAPLLAATDALSRAARRKSMALRRPKRSRSTRWSRSQTPACCQYGACASTSCPTRSPSPAAASPTECRIAGQRGSRSGLHDPARGADRLSASAARAVAAAPPPPKAYQ